MNKIIIKIKWFALCFLLAGGLMAQQRLTKVSQSIKVDKDVTIDLNTSHCNIIIDTWNKDVVEIEAYIEGDKISEEALENALKIWDVDIDASRSQVEIDTKGVDGRTWVYHIDSGDNEAVRAVFDELKFELADVPEISDFDFNIDVPHVMVLPEIPELPELPPLPPLPEGTDKVHFDYKAYKKDGEKYLEEYSREFESKYGKEYSGKMEAWGEEFSKLWEEKYGKEIQEWAKEFSEEWQEKNAERLKEWEEQFTKNMEKRATHNEARARHMEKRAAHEQERAKQMEKRNAHMEERQKNREKLRERIALEREKHHHKREKLAQKRKVLINKLVGKESNSKVKKTIKIKMPKKAKLKVNVRHGEIEFATNVENLNADLSHAKLTAYSINGSSTSVNASYSPIYVNYWNLGELNLRYTDKAQLKHVKQLVLNSNSSNTTIDHLSGNAVIDGNIGDLKILKIDDAFSNLNIIIQNSNAVISLPKVDHNLKYSGTHSQVNYPKKQLNRSNTSHFSSGSLSSGKSILVNAKYSIVTMR